MVGIVTGGNDGEATMDEIDGGNIPEDAALFIA